MSRSVKKSASGIGRGQSAQADVIGLWLRGLRVQSPSLTLDSRIRRLKSKCRAYLRGAIGPAAMIGELRRAARDEDRAFDSKVLHLQMETARFLGEVRS